jgi:mRNA interferase HigB
VHVISRKKLQDFYEEHPEAKTPLWAWYKIISTTDFDCFDDLRKTFATADQVQNLTVFNIGGNKFRLIAAIHYNRRKIYVRSIMTHNEYDKNRWKEDLQ